MVLLLTLFGLLSAANVRIQEPATASAATEPQSVARLEISPGDIEVGTLYGGTTVSVEGAIPAGYDAAVACVGKADTVELKMKGRVLGILWMNVGDVIFQDVPPFYVLNTSTKLAELAPPSVLKELQVGYPAIESTATRFQGDSDQHELFGELLKLKESERLYSYNEGGVQLEPQDGGAVSFSAQCYLPAKAPSGNYEIRLVAFKAGRGELLRVARLQVSPVGATAFISSLAQRQGLLYGVLAVVIALAVGLLTGFVFGLLAKTSR